MVVFLGFRLGDSQWKEFDVCGSVGLCVVWVYADLRSHRGSVFFHSANTAELRPLPMGPSRKSRRQAIPEPIRWPWPTQPAAPPPIHLLVAAARVAISVACNAGRICEAAQEAAIIEAADIAAAARTPAAESSASAEEIATAREQLAAGEFGVVGELADILPVVQTTLGFVDEELAAWEFGNAAAANEELALAEEPAAGEFGNAVVEVLSEAAAAEEFGDGEFVDLFLDADAGELSDAAGQHDAAAGQFERTTPKRVRRH
jgi:hypothetical protein